MSTQQQKAISMNDLLFSRTIAHINHKPSDLTAHCEECGKPIPVELSLCDACEPESWPDLASCPPHQPAIVYRHGGQDATVDNWCRVCGERITRQSVDGQWDRGDG